MQTETIMQDYGTNANGKDAVQDNDKDDVGIHPGAAGYLVTSCDDDRTLDTEVAVNEEVEDEYIHGIRLWLILISGTLVQFLIMLDVSVIATAVPRITTDFDSLLDVAWYGSAYQLASASLQPLTGKIYTFMSIKWTFLSFFALFELGSLLCGLAKSSNSLIVARAIAGLGASGLLNGGLTIVSACLPKHKRPAAMGIIIATGQFGQACGPLIGGAFTQLVSWRWCFFLNLPPVAFVFALLTFIDIPDSIAKPDLRTLSGTIVRTLDLVGFALFAPSAVMFFMALQFGGNLHPWGSPTVIGLFCGAGVLFTVFLFWERHMGDEAMIPFSILRLRIVWTSCVTMFFVVGVLTCAAYYLPIYFQAVLMAGPVMSGVLFLPNLLCQITMSMTAGVMVQKLGFYLPWILGGSALSAVGYGLLSMLTPTFPGATRIGFQIMAGVGCGSAATMPFIAVQNLMPNAQISIAMAILVFCLNFGGATFLTFAQTAFIQSLRVAIPKHAPGIDPDYIIGLGATGFQKVVPPEDLPGILMAYSQGVDHVFYLMCASSIAAFLFGWGMGWKDIRKH